MKTIKYILSIWTILSLSFFCFSCMDEEVSKSNQTWCDGKTLVLNLNAPATQIISPMTKSAQKDTVMTDLNVLIYKNGQLTDGFYYNSTNSADLIAALQKGEEKQLDIVLGKDATGSVYAVANYGSDVYSNLNKLGDDKSKFETESGLEKATFLLDGKQPKLYMYAKGGAFDVSSATQNKITMDLERIYSLVTVKIVKNLSQPNSGSFDVEPLTVQIKNIPTQGQFASKITGNEDAKGNLIGVNGVGCEVEGEMLSRTSEDDKNFLDAGHDEAQAFYLYENRQPEGSSLNNNTDQTTKTPHGLPADEIISIIKQNRTCSYIEVKGKYIRNGNPEGVGSGDIIYRFFLGKDIYKDFDIERNVHYQVTLTLNGKGGADEATWRVETKLIGEIQVEDVYVGYRAGSKSRMYVTGDVELVQNNITIRTTTDPTNYGKEGFTVSSSLQDANDGKGKYVEIEGLYTNVHDYSNKVGEITFELSGNGITKFQTAKVYQVPRLVDPIAFYKSANNDSLVNVVVKAYNYKTHQYEPLESKGPWSVQIESVGKGSDWFTISSNDDTQTAKRTNDVITGEGVVSFKYKPDSKLNNEDKRDYADMNGARFGKLVVKYHNNWCPHEIYLRQGYNPTSMGNQDFAWSMFNCLGKKSENDVNPGAVTNFPTQTGWLFNGGMDIAMHPFAPGYNQSYAEIEYSDGNTHEFGYKASSSNYNWGVKLQENQYVDLVKWGGKQGPCPDGYIVPTSQTYRDVTESATVYTGFVYDEDNVAGWFYNPAKGGGADIDETNHCNPAKGSLFISNDDGCTNIFFNYGKGVLTAKKNNDPNLVAEIGVGHRYNGEQYGTPGKLIYSNSTPQYGGYYWSGTVFEQGTNSSGVNNAFDPNGNPRVFSHMGKVDFGYDIFSKEPTLIDVPGKYSSLSQEDIAIGINGKNNGSFVRCVRSKDMQIVEYIIITVNATFRYYFKNPDGSITDFEIGSTSFMMRDDKGNSLGVLKIERGVVTGNAIFRIPKTLEKVTLTSGGTPWTVSVEALISGEEIKVWL